MQRDGSVEVGKGREMVEYRHKMEVKAERWRRIQRDGGRNKMEAKAQHGDKGREIEV